MSSAGSYPVVVDAADAAGHTPQDMTITVVTPQQASSPTTSMAPSSLIAGSMTHINFATITGMKANFQIVGGRLPPVLHFFRTGR